MTDPTLPAGTQPDDEPTPEQIAERYVAAEAETDPSSTLDEIIEDIDEHFAVAIGKFAGLAPARATAIMLVARYEKLVGGSDPWPSPSARDLFVELLELTIEVSTANARVEILRGIISGSDDEDDEDDKGDEDDPPVPREPVSSSGEPLAGRLKVNDEGLTFSV